MILVCRRPRGHQWPTYVKAPLKIPLIMATSDIHRDKKTRHCHQSRSMPTDLLTDLCILFARRTQEPLVLGQSPSGWCVCVQPSGSGDDERPFNILDNAVFLNILILFSSFVEFLKVIADTCSANDAHAQAILDLSKVTCGAVGTQCTMSCGRNWCMRSSVRRAMHVSVWTHTNLNVHILPIPATEPWPMQTIFAFVTCHHQHCIQLGGKLIKPLRCEIWKAISTIHMECVVPTYAMTAWWSDYPHEHRPEVIHQIHFYRVNTRTCLNTANHDNLKSRFRQWTVSAKKNP